MATALIIVCLLTADATLTETVTIPLDGGRLHVGTLLGDLVDRVGYDGQPLRDNLALSVDVTKSFGTLQLERIAAATGGVAAFEVDDQQLIMRIDRLKWRRTERELRTQLRTLMEDWFPQHARAAAARYGIRHLHGEYDDDQVVLIHGLDEPGDVWNALTPMLATDGFAVCEQTYPNDQPIAESARFFDAQLRILRQRGVRRVAIVAHSMGGLVSRWMLTGRDLPAERRPAVDVLIMVGTPNGGSEMARFRLGAEVREQVIRTLSGDGLLFGSVFDGAGEAQLDLLPQSDFLRELNGRPHPEGVAMTTIAGIASPVDDDAIARLKGLHLEQWTETFRQISDGVGDGCVSLESAKLGGVDDHVTVRGNHLNMIMHVPGSARREPPAAKVVMQRLRDWRIKKPAKRAP